MTPWTGHEDDDRFIVRGRRLHHLEPYPRTEDEPDPVDPWWFGPALTAIVLAVIAALILSGRL